MLFFFILQRCKMHHFKAFDIINLLWRLTLVLILQEHIQTIQVVEETLSYWIGTIWWKWPLLYWEKSFEHLKLDTVEKDSVGLTTLLVSKYSSCLKYRKTNVCTWYLTTFFSYFSTFFETKVLDSSLFLRKQLMSQLPLAIDWWKKAPAIIIEQ